MLRALGMPTEARWVLHHHEAADGSGYPSGLTGNGIPRESRIILLADAFEVMCATRPYSAAVSPREAFREIAACTPRQFDAELVAALEALVFYRARVAS
jgi:HD-GYP domain-containing protein (c-di-GMP phosphodiesterase class II)